MERKNHIIILLMLTLTGTSVFGSNRTLVYEAYITNRMDNWKLVVDKMEKEKTFNTDFILQLVNYQYGFIGYSIGTDQDDQAKDYLEKAEKNLEWLEKNNMSSSVINAYKAAFYGYKIGLSPLKAPFYGPKSINCAKKAMELDNKNPMGFIQYGNAQFYMPAVFGGSKTEAVKHFLKALELMETDRDNMTNDWNYLSLLVLIAQSYAEIKDYNSADYYYQKALKTEPGFLYVKNELYPKFLKETEKRNE